MSTLMVPDVNRESSVNELETLFREHHQLIYRTAYSITGSHHGTTNYVLAAGANKVYIYNTLGTLTKEGIPMKNFMRIGGVK